MIGVEIAWRSALVLASIWACWLSLNEWERNDGPTYRFVESLWRNIKL